LSWKIEDLDISKRAKTSLINGGCETVKDLVELSKEELSKLPGFGSKSLNEVVEVLAGYSIKLYKGEDEKED